MEIEKNVFPDLQSEEFKISLDFYKKVIEIYVITVTQFFSKDLVIKPTWLLHSNDKWLIDW